MPAFAPATDKIITSATPNLKDALQVDARDLVVRLLSDLGINQITAQNTAPADKSVLWWHKDVRQFKRWDGVNGNWFVLTPNQRAIHAFQRLTLGTVADSAMEAADTVTFWDVSLGEGKKITFANLAAQISDAALARIAARDYYIDTTSGPATHTLPASPVDGEVRRFFDVGGKWGVNNLTIQRNGKAIWGSSSDFVANRANIGLELQYVASANDWKVKMIYRSAYK